MTTPRATPVDHGAVEGRARPFRFALGAPAVLEDRRRLAEHAHFAEEAGFDVATFPDHFFLPLSPLLASAVVAELTTRLRVGTLMLAATFRNPGLLAKELATLDVLSLGRVEVGLGAGWMESEHLAAGLPFGRPAERIARVAEVAGILKAAWASTSLSHHGRFYELSDLPSAPAPFQEGGPPLMMGGGGPSVLAVAARHADIVTIAPGPIALGEPVASHAARLRERVALVREAAEAEGRSPELHILLSGVAVCDDRRRGARACLDALRQGGTDGEILAGGERSVLESPFFAVGPVREICDQLRGLRDELGISYFSVREHVARAFAPVVAELAGH